ncbi:MAG: hypothetical protein NTW19_00880 [Planctomycetota bacterium]|nr:hypothetical protein [Planctomycetota bacterium]
MKSTPHADRSNVTRASALRHSLRQSIARRAMVLLALAAMAAPAGAQAPAPAEPAKLPRTHPYQQALCNYMATLTAKDFDHGVTGHMEAKPGSTDPDYLYRNYIYTLTVQPLVGTKRGTPAVNAPPELFTLAQIESPRGVLSPPGLTEATMSFVQWDYPGNPFHNNRGLKMRAFVNAAVNMMMIDALVDKDAAYGRTDRLTYYLVRTAAGYSDFKTLLPAEAKKAFEDGLRKLAERVMSRAPQGEEANLDMMVPVGLSYVARALNDTEFTKRVEEHSKKFFVDPHFVHPAGYWVERGGLDINFSGTTNYFATWAALMNDWPWANEAVAKVYRLRAHLLLPEPNGKYIGPSAFNNRTSGSANNDQWDYANRDRGAAMITDEIAYLTPVPKKEELEGGGALRAQTFNAHIGENHRAGPNTFQTNEQIGSGPWTYAIFPIYNFPASVNPGYEFYKKGSLAHLEELEKKHSPMLKGPFERGENFIRDFGKAFIVARQPSFAAIIHAGPIGGQSPDDGLFQFNAPMGFGGGQLSAFWTPATGSVLLARRGGQHWERPLDLLPAWRTWPLHAVSGQNAEGTFFTSARIQKPESTVEVQGDKATVKVAGTIPATIAGQPKAIAGKYDYTREFKIDNKGVSVETTIAGDGKEQVSELYETFPVFLLDGAVDFGSEPKTTIEFQADGKWAAATEAYTENVKAVRVTRFTGAVELTFDKPRRVKLSPTEWKDAFLSAAVERNVMVDLLENKDQPTAVTGVKRVGYRIAAAK